MVLIQLIIKCEVTSQCACWSRDRIGPPSPQSQGDHNRSSVLCPCMGLSKNAFTELQVYWWPASWIALVNISWRYSFADSLVWQIHSHYGVSNPTLWWIDWDCPAHTYLPAGTCRKVINNSQLVSSKVQKLFILFHFFPDTDSVHHLSPISSLKFS